MAQHVFVPECLAQRLEPGLRFEILWHDRGPLSGGSDADQVYALAA